MSLYAAAVRWTASSSRHIESPALLLMAAKSSLLLKQLSGLKVAMVRPCFSPSALRTLETALLPLKRISVKSDSAQFTMCCSSLQQGRCT